MPYAGVYRSHSHDKTRKNGKNKIRPANPIFDGVIMPSVKGAVKNHNPRKGTETRSANRRSHKAVLVKNHSPRKGTETGSIVKVISPGKFC